MSVNSVAFVCVGNAGRGQMATAFAEREWDRYGLELGIVTGGTDPAEAVHDEVVEVMAEVDVDVGDRQPREITPEDLRDADRVVTMGCSVDEFRPDDCDGEAESLAVSSPAGGGLDDLREQRDEIERRVQELFDGIAA